MWKILVMIEGDYQIYRRLYLVTEKVCLIPERLYPDDQKSMPNT